jgi:hypothetical protein
MVKRRKRATEDKRKGDGEKKGDIQLEKGGVLGGFECEQTPSPIHIISRKKDNENKKRKKTRRKNEKKQDRTKRERKKGRKHEEREKSDQPEEIQVKEGRVCHFEDWRQLGGVKPFCADTRIVQNLMERSERGGHMTKGERRKEDEKKKMRTRRERRNVT